MKRDLKLCQIILETLERDENLDCNDRVYYHLLLLNDAKYINLLGSSADYAHEKGHKYFTKHTARLTWAGHDVLCRLRHNSYSGGSSGDNRLHWVFGVD